MDALKLIPQVFFDFIGRVAPGGVALLLYTYYFDSDGWTWSKLSRSALGLSSKQETPVLFSILTLFFLSYVTGHIVSPLTKSIQWVGEKWIDSLPNNDPESYEWLRFHHPDVGAQCAKLRAEFTMYNGLAAVFLIFSFVLLGRELQMHSHALFLFVLAVGMAQRGRAGVETFRKTVALYMKVSTGPKPENAA